MTAEPNSAVDGEIAGIERTMAENPRAYWSDDGLQNKYRGLLHARESGGSVTAPPSSRRAAIEKLMSDTRSDYWRGPDSERLQNEYRAILEREAGHSSPAAAAPDGRGLVSIPSARAAESESDDPVGFQPDRAEDGRGGDSAPVASPETVAKDFGIEQPVAELAVAAAGELERAFGASAHEISQVLSGSSDEVRYEMLDLIGNSYVPRTHHASRAMIEEFQATEYGRLCLAKWGSDAPRRLGILHAKAERFRERLERRGARFVAEGEFFWKRSLDAKHRALIADMLTG